MNESLIDQNPSKLKFPKKIVNILQKLVNYEN